MSASSSSSDSSYPFQTLEAQRLRAWRSRLPSPALEDGLRDPYVVRDPPLGPELSLESLALLCLQDVYLRFKELEGCEVRRLPAPLFADPTPFVPQDDQQGAELALRCGLEPAHMRVASVAPRVLLERVNGVMMRLLGEGRLILLPSGREVSPSKGPYTAPTKSEDPEDTQPLEESSIGLRLDDVARQVLRLFAEGRLRVTPEARAETFREALVLERPILIARPGQGSWDVPLSACPACRALAPATAAGNLCRACAQGPLGVISQVYDPAFLEMLYPLVAVDEPQLEPHAIQKIDLQLALSSGAPALARLTVLAYHLTGELPFREISLQAASMPDAQRPSLRPLVEPLLERYGADALRFALIVHLLPGHGDLTLKEACASAWVLLSRLYSGVNAYRALADPSPADDETLPSEAFTIADRWVMQRLRALVLEVRESLNCYRFRDAAAAISRFLRHDLEERYLAWAAPLWKQDVHLPSSQALVVTLYSLLDPLLRLLYPFVPFIAESLSLEGPDALRRSGFPAHELELLAIDKEAEEQMALVMGVVGFVRRTRQELRLEESVLLELYARPSSPALDVLLENRESLCRLAGLRTLKLLSPGERLAPAAHETVFGVALVLSLEDVFDLEGALTDLRAEQHRLEQELTSLGGYGADRGSEGELPESLRQLARRRQLTVQLEQVRSRRLRWARLGGMREDE